MAGPSRDTLQRLLLAAREVALQLGREREQPFEIRRTGWPLGHEAQAELEPCPRVAGLAAEAVREAARLFLREIAVQQHERLRRLHRREAHGTAAIGVGPVERGEQRLGQGTLEMHVEAAARGLLGWRPLPGFVGTRRRGESAV